MRGEYDNHLSVRYGSRSVSGAPGVVWLSGVACRKVDQREITQHQSPFDLTTAWVTLDSVELHPPLTSSPFVGALFTDYQAADEVEFDTAPGVWVSVCREERVAPFGRPAYWRYLLFPPEVFSSPPWPPPSPPPPPPPPPSPPVVSPGAGCDDAADLVELGTYTLSCRDDGTPGFYFIELFWASSIHVRVVGDMAPDVTIYVSTTTLGESCCYAPLRGTITYSGSRCVTLFHVGLEPEPGRVCIRVDNDSLSGPRPTVVEIAVGACGV